VHSSPPDGPSGPVRARLLIGTDDGHGLEHVVAGGAIAVTATSVRTLRSVQMKGRVDTVEPATDDDRARAARFADEFFTDIVETDHTPRGLVERMEPSDYVACRVTLDEVYDQTPGPAAGAPLREARP
jgi:hypothetical protein